MSNQNTHAQTHTHTERERESPGSVTLLRAASSVTSVHGGDHAATAVGENRNLQERSWCRLFWIPAAHENNLRYYSRSAISKEDTRPCSFRIRASLPDLSRSTYYDRCSRGKNHSVLYVSWVAVWKRSRRRLCRVLKYSKHWNRLGLFFIFCQRVSSRRRSVVCRSPSPVTRCFSACPTSPVQTRESHNTPSRAALSSHSAPI